MKLKIHHTYTMYFKLQKYIYPNFDIIVNPCRYKFVSTSDALHMYFLVHNYGYKFVSRILLGFFMSVGIAKYNVAYIWMFVAMTFRFLLWKWQLFIGCLCVRFVGIVFLVWQCAERARTCTFRQPEVSNTHNSHFSHRMHTLTRHGFASSYPGNAISVCLL